MSEYQVNSLTQRGLGAVYQDTSAFKTIFASRDASFENLELPERAFVINAREIVDSILSEKRDMDTLYATWILDLPYLKQRYGHGTVEKCIRMNKRIEDWTVWFPGVPSVSSEIDMMRACNIFVLTVNTTSNDAIEKNPRILLDPMKWIYAYLTEKRDLIEFTMEKLDQLFNKYKEDYGGRLGNRIQVDGILLPYFPPQKYNNIRNRTERTSSISESFDTTRKDTASNSTMSQQTAASQDKPAEPEFIGMEDTVPPSGTVKSESSKQVLSISYVYL